MTLRPPRGGVRVVTGPVFGAFGGVSAHVRALARHSALAPETFRLRPWSLWHPAWSGRLWKAEAEERRLPDPVLLAAGRRARGADVLHLHAYPHWRKAYFAAVPRFVYTVHQIFLEEDFAPADWPRWSALRDVTFEACRSADRVVSVAKWYLPRLEEAGIEAVHVPNGVDIGELRTADGQRFRDRFRIEDDFVLYASALLKYKRPELFVRAAEAMPDRRFVMAGRGTARDAVRAYVGRDLPPNLTCFGELPRELLLDAMAASRVVALPSTNEAFGIVLLEAMGLGKAVVAADAGGPKDFLAHRKTGFLFRADDAASFEQALRDAWDAPDVAAAGRALVEAEYDWVRIAPRIDAIWREVAR